MSAPATALLAELKRRGVTLQTQGGRLRFRPVNAVPASLLEELRAHRDELRQLLEQSEAPARGSASSLGPAPGSPAAQLEEEWREALLRAREGFRAAGQTPSREELVTAARVELKLAERAAELGAFAQAEDPLRDLLPALYSGALTARFGPAGEVLLSLKADA